MVKLIRSKGVGIYFITQIPGDVPESVLSQLGLKIQHALRGFTAKDKKDFQSSRKLSDNRIL
jgi:DNA helicase HerA-like ATPase